MRILAGEVPKQIGKKVEVAGWLHKKRQLGGITFVLLRDRSGLLQIKIESAKEDEKLRALQIGTVIAVKGQAVKDERAPAGVELHQPVINVMAAVTDEPPVEIDKPLSHQPEHLDTLLNHRPITLRNLKEQAIFKVQAKALEAFRSYFKAHDFIEINTPKLLAEATEGGAEVFKLDYFGKQATLAQSAQFYKQIMVGVFERVYEINPTYRAEPSATTRHMSEYITIDAEMGFVEFEELLNFAGSALLNLAKTVGSDCKEALKLWDVPKFVLPKLAAAIPRLSIAEIHQAFYKQTKEDHRKEDDLAPSEERWVCEWAKAKYKSEAVFVTGWSATSKTFKFYHQANAKNPQLADRADLLFRGVEIATLSMREHRLGHLLKQLKAQGGDAKNPGYAPLLSAYKYGMPPHGGFGWGLERTVEKLLNLNNVKEATLFPRDMQRLSP